MILSNSVQSELEKLLADLDMPNLYRSYKWNNDTWESGFPDLIRLEREISNAAKQNMLDKTHLQQIAQWGGLPNKKRISCQNPIAISLYTNGSPAMWLEQAPESTIAILQGQISGFGPTYYSKLLHFAVPQVFGALDSRLVSVFGNGAPEAQRYPLLDLKVVRFGGRGAISTSKSGWPREFGTWTAILKYIANTLNQKRIPCPPSTKIHGTEYQSKWHLVTG